MSFSDLVSGGPACGPSNPLQNLGKRFGQDRSSQMDRYDGESGGDAAAMRASFREQHGRHAGAVNDPAFFQQPGPSGHAFDLQPLQGALPLAHGSRSSPNPADMHSAWQHQRQHHSYTPSQREQFERSFRHGTPPSASVDPRWAREYSSSSTASNVQQQHPPQQHHIQQHHPQQSMMQGANPLLYHSRMSGMSAAAYRPGPEMNMGMADALQNGVPSYVNQQKLGDSTQWDTAFTEVEQRSKSASPSVVEQQPTILPATATAAEQGQRPVDPKEADELARTAGRLVSTVEHEQNNKFKQSNFLNLMRKIRDRQAGIQGTDIVESESGAFDEVQQSDKGKGRALPDHSSNLATQTPVNQMEAMNMRSDMGGASQMASRMRAVDLTQESLGRQELNEMWAEEDARSESIEQEAMKRMAFVGDGGNSDQLRAEDEAEFNKYQNLLGAHLGPAAAGLKNAQRNLSSMEEQFDELEGADFVGKRWQGTQGRGIPGMQAGEWDKLQADWDTWQAGSAGMEQSREAPVSASTAPTYRFHAYNPYVGEISNPAREASTASLPADMQSVLEREAAVQRDPSNAAAWLELGVKQQENERESLAIAALHRAIQLDPTIRDAWLALAVSYTNEADRSAALEAVERWVDATPEYRAIVRQHRQANGGEEMEKSKASQLPIERHEQIIKLLIALARHSSTEGKIDADIQVALGVLFNASEDYDKAVDCFTTALQVRPDDWLMYNRLGATLSNSGRSAEALRYYQQALDLKPGFVRCHFNMSISCLNLSMHRQAALHIYTALTLQSESVDLSSDAIAREQNDLVGSGPSGVTSSSLWETLRIACELMNRPDLANYAVQRDLDRFDPSEFFSPNEEDANMEPTV